MRADLSADFPLETWEVERLAIYNAEVSRGIAHTDQWRQQMERLQRRFDTVGSVNVRPRRWFR